jgi:hypothetical protein
MTIQTDGYTLALSDEVTRTPIGPPQLRPAPEHARRTPCGSD